MTSTERWNQPAPTLESTSAKKVTNPSRRLPSSSTDDWLIQQEADKKPVKAPTVWQLDEKTVPAFNQQLDQTALDLSDEASEEDEYQDISAENEADIQGYLVEDKTPDGYIVGEFGIVNRLSGNFKRGVRYTAHGSINPQLIQDALKTFLSL